MPLPRRSGRAVHPPAADRLSRGSIIPDRGQRNRKRGFCLLRPVGGRRWLLGDRRNRLVSRTADRGDPSSRAHVQILRMNPSPIVLPGVNQMHIVGSAGRTSRFRLEHSRDRSRQPVWEYDNAPSSVSGRRDSFPSANPLCLRAANRSLSQQTPDKPASPPQRASNAFSAFSTASAL